MPNILVHVMRTACITLLLCYCDRWHGIILCVSKTSSYCNMSIDSYRDWQCSWINSINKLNIDMNLILFCYFWIWYHWICLGRVHYFLTKLGFKKLPKKALFLCKCLHIFCKNQVRKCPGVPMGATTMIKKILMIHWKVW